MCISNICRTIPKHWTPSGQLFCKGFFFHYFTNKYVNIVCKMIQLFKKFRVFSTKSTSLSQEHKSYPLTYKFPGNKKSSKHQISITISNQNLVRYYFSRCILQRVPRLWKQKKLQLAACQKIDIWSESGECHKYRVRSNKRLVTYDKLWSSMTVCSLYGYYAWLCSLYGYYVWLCILYVTCTVLLCLKFVHLHCTQSCVKLRTFEDRKTDSV